MTKINYRIANNPREGEGVEWEEVEGVRVGGPFAIHKTTPYQLEGARYSIDHMPTGNRIVLVGTQEVARKVVKILRSFDIPWDGNDVDKIAEAIKRACPNLQIDLGMDGLIWYPIDQLTVRVKELQATGWQHTCYQKIGQQTHETGV